MPGPSSPSTSSSSARRQSSATFDARISMPLV
jgi:hypothetical protein